MGRVLHCGFCGCYRLFKFKQHFLDEREDSIYCIGCDNKKKVGISKNVLLLSAKDKERIKKIKIRRNF